MNSMTGYGSGSASLDGTTIKVDIKSLNNRYCDISIRAPREFIALEDSVRKKIKKNVSRGKIDVYINVEEGENSSQNIELNLNLAKKYYDALKLIDENLGLKSSISLRDIYNMSGVLNISTEDASNYAEVLDEAVEIALESFLEMRNREGESLRLDLGEKLENVYEIACKVREIAPRVIEENTKKLKDRISSSLSSEDLDIQRLSTEVAIMSDKLSIDEEITRVFLHIEQFNDIMNAEGAVGKKLDFLIQELVREVNTIGSKSSDIEILNYVVDLKTEIEKIREQVQNIE